jgi:hypothetical protein
MTRLSFHAERIDLRIAQEPRALEGERSRTDCGLVLNSQYPVGPLVRAAMQLPKNDDLDKLEPVPVRAATDGSLDDVAMLRSACRQSGHYAILSQFPFWR